MSSAYSLTLAFFCDTLNFCFRTVVFIYEDYLAQQMCGYNKLVFSTDIISGIFQNPIPNPIGFADSQIYRPQGKSQRYTFFSTKCLCRPAGCFMNIIVHILAYIPNVLLKDISKEHTRQLRPCRTCMYVMYLQTVNMVTLKEVLFS